VQFERVLGVSASFWTTRDAHYRAYLAMQEEGKELEKFTQWPFHFPLEEMRQRGWISKTSSGVPLVRELLTFFGVASPSNFDPLYLVAANHFRQSPKHPIDRHALAAWLRRGELLGAEMRCKPFDRQKFVQALAAARALTKEAPQEFIPRLKTLGGEAGVAIVFVHELPKVRTNGATRWITQDKALIQLSLRYKRSDILWFTFFHEAGHILLHGKKDVFVDREEQESNEKEVEANVFSSEHLIPSRDFREFALKKDFSRAAVENFADAIGVHPGIVVGRLHYTKLVPHSALTPLLMRLDPEQLGD
jgi:Zn-dependent peptidase ImmA (M78 family)